MTHKEAMQFISDYYYNDNPTEEDKFLFVEAQHFLINTQHDPRDMHNLAFFYLEERKFDLEYKYLEMSAEYGYYPAYEELGYIWYYGQTGTVDYGKAFMYLSMGAECDDDIVRIFCEFKLADMYRYGYFVDKDEAKYRRTIESLYDKMTTPSKIHSVFSSEYMYSPEITMRLAAIRAEDGRNDEARFLLKEAKEHLAELIRGNTNWWGNIEIMDEIVSLMHEVSTDDTRIDIYDLFWLSKKVCKLVFIYQNRRFIVNVVADEEGLSIGFENRWYRTARDFFEKAEIDGKKIVFIYDELVDVKVSGNYIDS